MIAPCGNWLEASLLVWNRGLPNSIQRAKGFRSYDSQGTACLEVSPHPILSLDRLIP